MMSRFLRTSGFFFLIHGVCLASVTSEGEKDFINPPYYATTSTEREFHRQLTHPGTHISHPPCMEDSKEIAGMVREGKLVFITGLLRRFSDFPEKHNNFQEVGPRTSSFVMTFVRDPDNSSVLGQITLSNDRVSYDYRWDPFCGGARTHVFPITSHASLVLQTLPISNPHLGFTMTRVMHLKKAKNLELLSADPYEDVESLYPENHLSLRPDCTPYDFERLLELIPRQKTREELSRTILPSYRLTWSADYLKKAVQSLAAVENDQVRAQLCRYAAIVRENFHHRYLLFKCLEQIDFFRKVPDEAHRISLQKSYIRSQLSKDVVWDMGFVSPPNPDVWPATLLLNIQNASYWCDHLKKHICDDMTEDVSHFIKAWRENHEEIGQFPLTGNIALDSYHVRSPFFMSFIDRYSALKEATPEQIFKTIVETIPDERIRMRLSVGTPDEGRFTMKGLEHSHCVVNLLGVMSTLVEQVNDPEIFAYFVTILKDAACTTLVASKHIRTFIERCVHVSQRDPATLIKTLIDTISKPEVKEAFQPFATEETALALGGLGTPQEIALFLRMIYATTFATENPKILSQMMACLKEGFYREIKDCSSPVLVERLLLALTYFPDKESRLRTMGFIDQDLLDHYGPVTMGVLRSFVLLQTQKKDEEFCDFIKQVTKTSFQDAVKEQSSKYDEEHGSLFNWSYALRVCFTYFYNIK